MNTLKQINMMAREGYGVDDMHVVTGASYITIANIMGRFGYRGLEGLARSRYAA